MSFVPLITVFVVKVVVINAFLGFSVGVVVCAVVWTAVAGVLESCNVS